VGMNATLKLPGVALVLGVVATISLYQAIRI
jgi:hypothetical protein